MGWYWREPVGRRCGRLLRSKSQGLQVLDFRIPQNRMSANRRLTAHSDRDRSNKDTNGTVASGSRKGQGQPHSPCMLLPRCSGQRAGKVRLVSEGGLLAAGRIRVVRVPDHHFRGSARIQAPSSLSSAVISKAGSSTCAYQDADTQIVLSLISQF